MTTIEKIKAEIERLYNGEAPKHDQQCDFDDGYFTGIGAISQFIDTLESEKPMSQEELEEEINRTYHDGSVADTSDLDHNSYENIARHFYEIGCRRTAEKYDEIEYNRQIAEESVPNDLEEAAEDSATKYYIDGGYSPFQNIERAAHIAGFIAAAKWDREQMMKEAVEGEVVQDLKGVNRIKSFSKIPEWLHFGDKVRIIVCKNED